MTSLGGIFLGGEGGAVAPYGLLGGEGKDEGARSRPVDYGGGGKEKGARSRPEDYGGDCLGLFSIVYCF